MKWINQTTYDAVSELSNLSTYELFYENLQVVFGEKNIQCH